MNDLEAMFRREKVLSMEAVKRIIGTRSRMTAFRRLKALSYRSSYSHRGMYYTLEDIPTYDAHGVWLFHDVGFSRYGTLLATVEALVQSAASGCTAGELAEALHVRVHNALKTLIDQGRLVRRQIGSEYVYAAPGKSGTQWAARKRAITRRRVGTLLPGRMSAEEMSEHLTTFLSVLNEKQRRLYLGLESLKIGRGGDVAVASLAGVNVKTVARGRRELISKTFPRERVRAPGAGRPPLKKTR